MKRLTATLAALTLIAALPTTTHATTGTCTQYEHLLTIYAPRGGWNIPRMSRYMWRESRCQPHVRSRTRDSGLLQINDINLAYLTTRLGRRITPATLMNPTTNIQAAAQLCIYARRAWGNCYQPWGR